MIAEAMERVGKDGVITVEEGKRLETEVEWVEGMQFDKGYLSPHFVTDAEQDGVRPRGRADPHPREEDLVHQGHDPAARAGRPAGRPLLIIAEDIEGEALATLVVNRLRGSFPCVAVKAPGFGDRRKAMLQDIAVLTGATAVMERPARRLEGATLTDLGSAKKVIVSKDDTTIIEGAGKKGDIQGRIEQIKAEIETTKSDYDREKLQERLAKLVGRRGADQRRRRDRVRDEGEEGARRGRAPRHPCGRRRGHRPRRRHGAPVLHRHHREAQARR